MIENYKTVADKLSSANSVLVVLPSLATADATAAGLALVGYLKKLEKDSVLVSSDGVIPSALDFLPGYDQIMRDFSLSKSFVIDLSTKRTQLSELSYKKENDKLSIFLKPKSGEFLPSDVTFNSSKFPYDAVVVIGVERLDALGGFYAKFAELFFETPVVNIDYRGTNQNFAQFNLVALNSTSQSEIVFDLINEMEKELIDEHIATTLLAGIISETNSFQHTKTTPQVFVKASQLVGLGGNQQNIINKFYKNKSMGFLKLWGRVLARLKHEPENFLAHSSVNRLDVEKSGASYTDALGILREMVKELGFAKVHVFFSELDSQTTEVYLAAPSSLNLSSVFSLYQPESLPPQAIKFRVAASLVETEQQILEIIRKESIKLS